MHFGNAVVVPKISWTRVSTIPPLFEVVVIACLETGTPDRHGSSSIQTQDRRPDPTCNIYSWPTLLFLKGKEAPINHKSL